MIPRFVASFLLALFVMAGCHSGQKASTESASGPNVKIYKLRGKVISTNAVKGEATLDHEAIAGLMGAMTMPYKLKDPSILSELHPGDVITADVLVSQDPDADMLLDQIVVVAQARPDYKPGVSYHVPAQGDAVPDFKLRNQDGRTIHLNQFHGKALLVTFIYTRCPSPEFCPRVTRNFAQVDKELAVSPALYAKSHLLCVSFDPEHDTPARLRAYGATYIGAGRLCALGLCRDGQEGPSGDGAVFRSRHDQRGRLVDYTHSFNYADRAGRQGGTFLSGQRVDGGSTDCGRAAEVGSLKSMEPAFPRRIHSPHLNLRKWRNHPFK